jgi:hypothetical protein
MLFFSTNSRPCTYPGCEPTCVPESFVDGVLGFPTILESPVHSTYVRRLELFQHFGIFLQTNFHNSENKGIPIKRYMRERAKKPPNSEAYTQIEKKPSHNLRTIKKKNFATVL